MSLDDVIAQKTGVDPAAGGGVPANRQQRTGGGALSAVGMQSRRSAASAGGPSLSVSAASGTVVLDTLTLALYGILLADLLLVAILLKV